MILGCSALSLKYISIIVAMAVKRRTRRSNGQSPEVWTAPWTWTAETQVTLASLKPPL